MLSSWAMLVPSGAVMPVTSVYACWAAPSRQKDAPVPFFERAFGRFHTPCVHPYGASSSSIMRAMIARLCFRDNLMNVPPGGAAAGSVPAADRGRTGCRTGRRTTGGAAHSPAPSGSRLQGTNPLTEVEHQPGQSHDGLALVDRPGLVLLDDLLRFEERRLWGRTSEPPSRFHSSGNP